MQWKLNASISRNSLQKNSLNRDRTEDLLIKDIKRITDYYEQYLLMKPLVSEDVNQNVYNKQLFCSSKIKMIGKQKNACYACKTPTYHDCRALICNECVK